MPQTQAPGADRAKAGQVLACVFFASVWRGCSVNDPTNRAEARGRFPAGAGLAFSRNAAARTQTIYRTKCQLTLVTLRQSVCGTSEKRQSGGRFGRELPGFSSNFVGRAPARSTSPPLWPISPDLGQHVTDEKTHGGRPPAGTDSQSRASGRRQVFKGHDSARTRNIF